MPDPVSDRLRDRLAVNPPYEGVLADAYDAWLPGDATFADDVVYERLLAEVDGPVLELGCGTGRPLLRWLAAGHDVEGVDDVVSAYREAGEPPVVCLAGSDATYEEWGAELVSALRDAGARHVIVAGRADIGADDSASAGLDALDFLRRTREHLA